MIRKTPKEAAMLPNDPVMLLSYINTQLRDHYSSLDELCSSLVTKKSDIENKLNLIDYYYDSVRNQFV